MHETAKRAWEALQVQQADKRAIEHLDFEVEDTDE